MFRTPLTGEIPKITGKHVIFYSSRLCGFRVRLSFGKYSFRT